MHFSSAAVTVTATNCKHKMRIGKNDKKAISHFFILVYINSNLLFTKYEYAAKSLLIIYS